MCFRFDSSVFCRLPTPSMPLKGHHGSIVVCLVSIGARLSEWCEWSDRNMYVKSEGKRNRCKMFAHSFFESAALATCVLLPSVFCAQWNQCGRLKFEWKCISFFFRSALRACRCEKNGERTTIPASSTQVWLNITATSMCDEMVPSFSPVANQTDFCHRFAVVYSDTNRLSRRHTKSTFVCRILFIDIIEPDGFYV